MLENTKKNLQIQTVENDTEKMKCIDFNYE